jgi:hypothetical protein
MSVQPPGIQSPKHTYDCTGLKQVKRRRNLGRHLPTEQQEFFTLQQKRGYYHFVLACNSLKSRSLLGYSFRTDFKWQECRVTFTGWQEVINRMGNGMEGWETVYVAQCCKMVIPTAGAQINAIFPAVERACSAAKITFVECCLVWNLVPCFLYRLRNLIRSLVDHQSRSGGVSVPSAGDTEPCSPREITWILPVSKLIVRFGIRSEPLSHGARRGSVLACWDCALNAAA